MQIGTNLFPILKNTQYCNRHRLYVYPRPEHEIRGQTAAGQNQKFPARPTSHGHLVVVECMPSSTLTNSEQESLQQSFNSFRRLGHSPREQDVVSEGDLEQVLRAPSWAWVDAQTLPGH